MTDKRMVELARLVTRARNRKVTTELEGLVNVVMKVMLSGLEGVMKAVYCERLKTLKSCWIC
ncbi:hypothetical protein DVH24_040006 [Malus domestica]|uniref:Uncharacterized protein n=1 Tax=Malus domestica TaxID=3750 RepID=A0A498I7J0_MALDO|nr:hypothetical protein DVH24_040006 [Malus domestica]